MSQLQLTAPVATLGATCIPNVSLREFARNPQAWFQESRSGGALKTNPCFLSQKGRWPCVFFEVTLLKMEANRTSKRAGNQTSHLSITIDKPIGHHLYLGIYVQLSSFLNDHRPFCPLHWQQVHFKAKRRAEPAKKLVFPKSS